jgi:4-aminobutyrate aminotransferase-like enzyme
VAMANAMRLQDIGREKLGVLVERFERIGDYRQYGAWGALEFVTDKQSRVPDPATQAAFHQAALRRGVFAISSPEKWVYRLQPELTMEADLFAWSCDQLADAAAEVLG